MACDFSLPISDNPEAVLSKARKAIESQGGLFTGDTHSGNFSVTVFGNKIVGAYNSSGQSMNIQITEKPFLIPCSTIESFLKNQIS